MFKKLIELAKDKAFEKVMAMFILILCILILGAMGIIYLITKVALDPVSGIATGIVSIITGISGYYWGSSASSRDKDVIINNLTNGKDNQ